MSNLKRGRTDGGVAVKVEESESDISIVRSMRDIAEAHYSYRDVPPAHYTLKIDSFSKFFGAMQCYTSQTFEAGAYKWKLSLYPKGDEERDGKGHISMYLIIEDTKDFPDDWEVSVVYKFFILDQIRYKFLAVEDALRRTSRFSATKTEWGISKLLPYRDFSDKRSGFLVKDTCIFGVEISFINPPSSVSECISPMKDFDGYTYKWKIHPFSSFTSEHHESEIFTAGKINWKLKIYPRGNRLERNKSLSVYLKKAGFSEEVYADYKLCIQDQRGAKHHQRQTSVLFNRIPNEDWGFADMLSLDDLNDPSNGFLVEDTMIIEVHISNISSLKRDCPL